MYFLTVILLDYKWLLVRDIMRFVFSLAVIQHIETIEGVMVIVLYGPIPSS